MVGTGRGVRTGRPARMHAYDDVGGEVAIRMRQRGIGWAAGAPIVVEGRPWGVMSAASNGDEPRPGDTESRIAAFTELVATAISNSEARAELARLAAPRIRLIVSERSSFHDDRSAVRALLRRLLHLLAECPAATDSFQNDLVHALALNGRTFVVPLVQDGTKPHWAIRISQRPSFAVAIGMNCDGATLYRASRSSISAGARSQGISLSKSASLNRV